MARSNGGGLIDDETAPSSADLNQQIENPRLYWHRDSFFFADEPDDLDSPGAEIECVFWSLVMVDEYAQALERGLLHRDNGPAVEWEDGCEDWYRFGELHRKDGPAHTENHPEHGYSEVWYRNGQIHREDEPAVICEDGRREWWRRGQLYRKNGPAIISGDGTESWFKNGKQHRDGDKPAVVYSDGTLQWFQDGEQHRGNGLPAFVSATGEGVGWWQFGQLHREHGPACIKSDGVHLTYSWYRYGQLHREGDKPAVIGNGGVSYFRDGQSHRDGGKPSVVAGYGERMIIEWAENGIDIAQLVITDYDELCLTLFSTGPGQLSPPPLTDIPSIAEFLVDHRLTITDEIGDDHQDLMRCLAVEMMVLAAADEFFEADTDSGP